MVAAVGLIAIGGVFPTPTRRSFSVVTTNVVPSRVTCAVATAAAFSLVVNSVATVTRQGPPVRVSPVSRHGPGPDSTAARRGRRSRPSAVIIIDPRSPTNRRPGPSSFSSSWAPDRAGRTTAERGERLVAAAVAQHRACHCGARGDEVDLSSVPIHELHFPSQFRFIRQAASPSPSDLGTASVVALF